MPNRQYVASGGRWPRWSDHLLAHIHEACVAMTGTLFGMFLLLGTRVEVLHVSDYLQQVDTFYEVLMGTTLFVGGLLNLFATMRDFETRATYWLWKRTGIVLAMTGWLTFSVTLYATSGRFLTTVFLTTALGATSLLSLIRTLLDERRIEEAHLDAYHRGALHSEQG